MRKKLITGLSAVAITLMSFSVNAKQQDPALAIDYATAAWQLSAIKSMDDSFDTLALCRAYQKAACVKLNKAVNESGLDESIAYNDNFVRRYSEYLSARSDGNIFKIKKTTEYLMDTLVEHNNQ